MTTTETILAVLTTLAVGGSGVTALLNYLAGGRKVRRETEQELWQRLVTERTRAETERDQAETERDAERAYSGLLERTLAAHGIAIPDRPQRART